MKKSASASASEDKYTLALERLEAIPHNFLKESLTCGVARLTKTASFSLTPDQLLIYQKLGGANWVRSMLSLSGQISFPELAMLRPDLPDAQREQYALPSRVADAKAFDPLKTTSISASRILLDVFRQLPIRANPLCIGVLREMIKDTTLSVYADEYAVLLTPTMAELSEYKEPKTWEIIQPYLYVGDGRYLRLASVAWLLAKYKDEDDLFVVDDDILKTFSFTYPANADFCQVQYRNICNYNYVIDRDLMYTHLTDKYKSDLFDSSRLAKVTASEVNAFDRKIDEAYERFVRDKLDFSSKAVSSLNGDKSFNTHDTLLSVQSRMSYPLVTPFDAKLQNEIDVVSRTLLSKSPEDHYRQALGIKGVYFIKAATARPWAVKIMLSDKDKDNTKMVKKGMTYYGAYRNYIDATLAAIEARMYKSIHDDRTDEVEINPWAKQLNANQEIFRVIVKQKARDIQQHLGTTPIKRTTDVIMADYSSKLLKRGTK